MTGDIQTDRCQLKLHPPVRFQPRQPRWLQFADEEGGLQTLALEAMDETHPAGRTVQGSVDRVPLAGGVIGPRSRKVPVNTLSYKFWVPALTCVIARPTGPWGDVLGVVRARPHACVRACACPSKLGFTPGPSHPQAAHQSRATY